MRNLVLKDYVRQAMVAAIYVALVQIFHFSSFGPIQFRVAEVLMVLVLFDKKYIIGVTIGCFLANLLGSAIMLDVIFGTMATAIAGILMHFTKRFVVIALFWPVIVNAIIIGLILTYAYKYGPFPFHFGSVFVGQAAIIYLLGLPVYFALKNNKGFVELVEN